jgi:hypothetical protein
MVSQQEHTETYLKRMEMISSIKEQLAKKEKLMLEMNPIKNLRPYYKNPYEKHKEKSLLELEGDVKRLGIINDDAVEEFESHKMIDYNYMKDKFRPQTGFSLALSRQFDGMDGSGVSGVSGLGGNGREEFYSAMAGRGGGGGASGKKVDAVGSFGKTGGFRAGTPGKGVFAVVSKPGIKGGLASKFSGLEVKGVPAGGDGEFGEGRNVNFVDKGKVKLANNFFNDYGAGEQDLPGIVQGKRGSKTVEK